VDEADAEPSLQAFSSRMRRKVERRQGLVEQQHLRVGDQRARHPLLAARWVGPAGGGMGPICTLQRSSARARASPVDAPQAEGDIVCAIEMREGA
jgi:hypothetical protein